MKDDIMALSSEDKNDITAIVAQALQVRDPVPQEKKNDLSDQVQKIATALITAAMLWVGTTLTGVKTEQQLTKKDLTGALKSIEKVDAQTEDRFTREDFNRERKNLIEDVEKLSREIITRGPIINKTVNDIELIRRDLDRLQIEMRGDQ